VRKRKHYPQPSIDALIVPFSDKLFPAIGDWERANPTRVPKDRDGNPDRDVMLYAIECALHPERHFNTYDHAGMPAECIWWSPDYFFAVAAITREWLRSIPLVPRWLMLRCHTRRDSRREIVAVRVNGRGYNLGELQDGEIARLIEESTGTRVTATNVRYWRTYLAKHQ
jgi:hypothetical protein